jgi:Tfp pilus assembly protein PilF
VAKGLIANLEALLAKGSDSPALRLALANGYLASGSPEAAVRHAAAALAQDEQYSAAWKALGKAQAAAGHEVEAAETYRRGIEIAEQRGDRQAANEMRVFLKRLASGSDPQGR